MIYYIIYYHLKNTKRFCPHDFGVRAPRTPTLRVSVSSLIRYEYENLQAPLFNWVIAQRQIGTCLTGRSPHARTGGGSQLNTEAVHFLALSISLMLHYLMLPAFLTLGMAMVEAQAMVTTTYRCLEIKRA